VAKQWRSGASVALVADVRRTHSVSYLLRKHEGFSHNASPSWEADMAGRGFSSGSKDSGISVYVGAAAADLQPLLAADIGILVDPEPEVLRLLPAFGVEVRLLMTGARAVSGE